MLSVSQTADAMIKRLTAKSKAYREVYVVKKEVTDDALCVVLGASCIELCRESLGRALVKKIKSLNYHRKPSRVGFTIDGRAFGVSCDYTEVLVAIIWNNTK
jgi:hypothetical protein